MTYFNESAILEHDIKTGADHLIAQSAKTSKNDPPLAVAQMVLGAASLCFADGITEKEFRKAVDLAVMSVWGTT